MRTIPSQIAASTRSGAERRLFQMFRDISTAPDYCCLHSVNLPDHEYKVCGELDFVVVSPRGLYVLEVKGGGVSCDANGIWSFENRNGDVGHSSEGPFQQARSGMFALRSRLLTLVPEADLSRMVMGYGVVFPDRPFNAQSVEWPREIILDGTRLRSQGLASYLRALETYWHAKLPHAPARVEPALVSRVVKAMRPEFDMAPSLQIQADEIEGRLVRMTDSQYAVLDAIEECERILVQGGAGTGKTFLALEVARRMAASGKNVLFLCFSPVLAAYLARQTHAPSIRIVSIHALMLDVVRQYGNMPSGYLPTMPETDPWYIQRLLPAFEQAVRQLPAEALADMLIIDEAQDILNLDYLSAVNGLLHKGLEHGVWRIFYDPFNQAGIFGAMDPEALAMLRSWGAVPVRLKTNCRNTDQIVLQTRVVTGADMGVQSTGPGPEVSYATYQDTTGQQALLEGQLEELWNRQVDGRDITILSPLPFTGSAASRLGRRWRQRITVLSRNGSMKFPLPGLTFATVADFKGLENRYILLVDISDLDSSPAALATLYVGMSRARVGLWVALPERLIPHLRELGQQHLARVLEDMQHDR